MKRALFCVALALALVLPVCGVALAGGFQTLPGVANGGTVSAYGAAFAYGPAMEMVAYEFASTTVVDNYRCRIILNRTNRPLNIRLIGVNATVIGSCTAPVGGNCVTPTFALVPNLKFWCVVATQNGAPAVGYWVMGVQRP